MNRHDAARAHARAMVGLGYVISWDTDYATRANDVEQARAMVSAAILRLPEAEQRPARGVLVQLDKIAERLDGLAREWHEGEAS